MSASCLPKVSGYRRALAAAPRRFLRGCDARSPPARPAGRNRAERFVRAVVPPVMTSRAPALPRAVEQIREGSASQTVPGALAQPAGIDQDDLRAAGATLQALQQVVVRRLDPLGDRRQRQQKAGQKNGESSRPRPQRIALGDAVPRTHFDIVSAPDSAGVRTAFGFFAASGGFAAVRARGLRARSHKAHGQIPDCIRLRWLRWCQPEMAGPVPGMWWLEYARSGRPRQGNAARARGRDVAGHSTGRPEAHRSAAAADRHR